MSSLFLNDDCCVSNNKQGFNQMSCQFETWPRRPQRQGARSSGPNKLSIGAQAAGGWQGGWNNCPPKKSTSQAAKAMPDLQGLWVFII